MTYLRLYGQVFHIIPNSNLAQEIRIWTNKKYAIFTDIMSKLESEKMVYLRLANLEENNKNMKENF